MKRERIRYYLEARRMASKTIVYHGTSTKFLARIKKEGLVPNPKTGVWVEEEISGWKPSRKSLPGAYFSRSFDRAFSYANDTSRKLGGNPLLVVADIQERSALPDEDAFSWTSELYFADGTTDPELNAYALANYLVNIELDTKWGQQYLAYYVKRALEAVNMGQADTRILTARLRVLAVAELKRRLAIMMVKEKDRTDRYIEEAIESVHGNDYWPIIPDRKTAEADKRQALDLVLKSMKKSVRNDALGGGWRSREGTMRLPNGVSYRGNNRIVALVEIIREADPEKEWRTKRYIVRPHYGKVPADLARKLAVSQFGEAEADANMNRIEVGE